MTGKLDPQTRDKIDTLLIRAADQVVPVFVVKESEAERLVEMMYDSGLTIQQRIRLAKKSDIPIVDGMDYLEHLAGEMHPDSEEFLRYRLMKIRAAKRGAVILDGTTTSNPWLKRGETIPLREVPVDDLDGEDFVPQWLLSDLKQLARKDFAPLFAIHPTERVEEFLLERGPYVGEGYNPEAAPEERYEDESYIDYFPPYHM
jgi:hypothetical protein